MIDSLVVKLAAPCNMNCRYCYVYNHEDDGHRRRPKQMSDEIFEAMLGRVARYGEGRPGQRMSLTFHGGEPTLVGADRFDALVTRARTRLGEQLGNVSIQTNGTLLDEDWIAVFRRHRVHVGVSLDGPPAINDLARIYHDGRGTHADVETGIRLLRDAGLSFSILCVVQPGQSGLAAYRHFLGLGARQMDFLLPDVSHDNKPSRYGRFGRRPVARYLIPIFDEWFDEDDPNVRIRLFVGLLKQLLGGRSETDAFGNPLMGYLIVETDGSIEGLDALRVCEDGMGRSGLNVRTHDFDQLHLGLPLVHRLVHEGVALSTQCRACPEASICGGGYLPTRYARANGFDNPSVWCEDILEVLSHVRARLATCER